MAEYLPDNATTVRVEGGKTLTTDGPFVGMKEAVVRGREVGIEPPSRSGRQGQHRPEGQGQQETV